MNRQIRKQTIHETIVTSDNRDIIQSDTRKLLIIQREGNFTYRCIDCCHSPKVCIPSFFAPCYVHAKNAKELNMEKSFAYHALMCLLAPFYIGSYFSVGKAKTLYRQSNQIPGLEPDDIATGVCCPCCSISQLRYELDEKANEEKMVKDLEIELGILTIGQQMERN